MASDIQHVELIDIVKKVYSWGNNLISNDENWEHGGDRPMLSYEASNEFANIMFAINEVLSQISE